jgi:hypothetical protein
MLWNPEFLLVHYPRTAAKSLSIYFASIWKGPIFGSVSKGHLRDISALPVTTDFIVEGRGNENLQQSIDILYRYGRNIEQFKAIFLPMRHPYQLMISQYLFMRENYESNKNRANFKLAASESFEIFCTKFEPAAFENWFTLTDGTIPNNLRPLRLESIEQDITEINLEFGTSTDIILGNHNATRPWQIEEYLTKKSEIEIFTKYETLFNFGGYSRIPSSDLQE